MYINVFQKQRIIQYVERKGKRIIVQVDIQLFRTLEYVNRWLIIDGRV